MQQSTGELRELKDIPVAEKKSWREVIPSMFGRLSKMTPEERVERLKEEDKKRDLGAPITEAFFKPALRCKGKVIRKKRRRRQKLARKLNRR